MARMIIRNASPMEQELAWGEDTADGHRALIVAFRRF